MAIGSGYNAADDVRAMLAPGEEVEAVVFGGWGYGAKAGPGLTPPPMGVRMSWAEAQDYMVGWSFDGGFGSPECYAVWIWTDRQVMHVHEYDGSTSLVSTPRHPVDTEARLS